MKLKNVYTWINPVVSKTEYKFETICNWKTVFAKTQLTKDFLGLGKYIKQADKKDIHKS